MPYQISDSGLKALKLFEGSRNKSYYDVAHNLTIGVGHLLTQQERTSGILDATGNDWHDGITDTEILIVLRKDVQRFVDGVNKALPCLRLFQHEFDALVCFTFNIGLGAFQGSTMRQMLLEGNYKGAPNEFQRWVRAGGKVIQGLVNRRAKEAKLFTEGVYPA